MAHRQCASALRCNAWWPMQLPSWWIAGVGCAAMPGLDRTPPQAALYLAFAGCVLIWGSTFLFIAIGNDTLAPTWGAALRLGLAAAILFAVMAVRRLPLPRGAALKAAATYGLFQFGLNFPLLYLGETEVPSGLAAVIFATIP